MAKRAGWARRALRDDGGNLLIVAGITLMLAFIVTSVTLSEVNSLESRSLQDRDNSFLNEYRFLHEKLASSLSTTVASDVDLTQFRSEFATIEETLRILEAAKGYDVVLRIGDTTSLSPGFKNELAFVNPTTGFYEDWSFDGANNLDHIPYDGTNDGVIRQGSVIVGVVVNLRLSDGVRSVTESVLFPTNSVDRDPANGEVASAPQNLAAFYDGSTAYLVWDPPAANADRVQEYAIYSTANGATTYHGRVSEESIALNGLSPGVAYTFKVRAVTEYLASNPATLLQTLA
ncbi:MAG TPA: fibronectin type III domain-containing protein, partial [Candidatus Thermoplasmatota archaeon]|nr:fibronectin type III domain-containing protein [Candidatus Thermoplasmatota archaeon]